MRPSRVLIPLVPLLLPLAAGPLSAAPAAPRCAAPGPAQSALLYLRRLSLDLRGTVPTLDELRQVAKAGEVPGALIDKMLASNAFVAQMRAYHRDLIWGNIKNLQVASPSWVLSGNGTTKPYYNILRARTYRGARNAGCRNEPATFDAQGRIVAKPDPFDPSIRREGWVEVRPYWAPNKVVRVCAFDAQARPTYRYTYRGRTYNADCSKSVVKGCGCGPNLRWCQVTTGGLYSQGTTQRMILEGLMEQTYRLIDRVVRGDRPYTEVLTSQEVEVNGPVAHWLKYQLGPAGRYVFTANGDLGYQAPPLKFTDVYTWVKVRVDPTIRYAGILTQPLYLLRFQTNRGRATRFFNAFLCQDFIAPPGGLPPGSDPCNAEPNLMQRCGCKYCHKTLEPATAHWARWAERGIGALRESRFPDFSKACAKTKGVSATCRRFYVTSAKTAKEKAYLGKLKGLLFATPEMETAAREGPMRIVRQAINTGAFATCTAKKLWKWFTTVDPTCDALKARMTALGRTFKASGYKLRALVKALVTSPEYRRLAPAKEVK